MDFDSARAFLRSNHHAVFVTTRSDGTAQLSPVVAAVEESGHVLVSTLERSVKTQNVRQNPAVSLCVFTDGFFGPWAQIDGTCEIVELPDAMEGLVEYYRLVAGEHPDWDAYRSSMASDGRVLLRISMSRVGPRAN